MVSLGALCFPRSKPLTATAPKETKDVNVLDVTKNRGTFIEYKTPAEVKAEFDKKANLQMWDAEKRKAEWDAQPKGGKLFLTINRLTIGECDTRWFTIVVQDKEGKEVYRQELERSVASPWNGYWQNLGISYLPEELKTGAVVYVVDSITKNRHEYLIKND